MADQEVILELGAEGGMTTIVRTPLSTGGWQFHVTGRGICLDENDDESWRSWRSEPLLSIEEALRGVASDGSWVFFSPLTVHPDYRAAVWELAQAVAGKLPKGSGESWNRRRDDWRLQCQPESC